MKLSKFTIIFDSASGEKILYNSYTGALAKIDEEHFNFMKRAIHSHHAETVLGDIPERELKAVADLAKYKFIVDDNLDELELSQEFSAKQRYNEKSLKLVIAPTLKCNFSCPYCYEVSQDRSMNKQVQKDIIEFVRCKVESSPVEAISVVWYGGEPLLCQSIISAMSAELLQICNNKQIKYGASIITNGYLLNETSAGILKNAHIRFAQITVDGPKHVHNQRRSLRDKPEVDTYAKIIEGINLLNREDIRVSIRMNADIANKNSLEAGIKDLAQFVLDKDCSSVYIARVFPTNEGHCTECMSQKEFGLQLLNCVRQAYAYGFQDAVQKSYPKLRLHYCSATLQNNYVFDPDGFIYKCWNDVGLPHNSIGVIHDWLYHGKKLEDSAWLSYSALNFEKCRNCSVLPICGGSCPRETIYNDSSPKCELYRYVLQDLLKLQYSHNAASQPDVGSD